MNFLENLIRACKNIPFRMLKKKEKNHKFKISEKEQRISLFYSNQQNIKSLKAFIFFIFSITDAKNFPQTALHNFDKIITKSVIRWISSLKKMYPGENKRHFIYRLQTYSKLHTKRKKWHKISVSLKKDNTYQVGSINSSHASSHYFLALNKARPCKRVIKTYLFTQSLLLYSSNISKQ